VKYANGVTGCLTVGQKLQKCPKLKCGMRVQIGTGTVQYIFPLKIDPKSIKGYKGPHNLTSLFGRY